MSALITLVVLLLCGVHVAEGSDDVQRAVTRETVLQWAERYRDAQPAFRAGDTLVLTDLEKVRPFMPPGYFEEFDFPGVELAIAPVGDYAPLPAYRAATEKYSSQVRLADDGTLEGYVAGQPFANAALDPADPLAGLRAIWNFNFRWQHYGQRIDSMYIALVRSGGGQVEQAGIPAHFLTGGGTLERVIVERYQRVYFTHVATLPGNDYTVALPGAEAFEWKDYLEFTDPYDVRGQRMVVQRASDPHSTDQAWTYSPSLRRVRRISAEEKSDSFLGTDSTLDDFYGFSGRVLEHDWKFHGWKTVLAVMDSPHPYARYFGPYSRVPHDRWEVRRCALIEQVPKAASYPYSSKLLFVDAQTYGATTVMAFDRGGKLWKIWNTVSSWSENPNNPQNHDQGRDVSRFLGVAYIDVTNNRGTVLAAWGTDYPEVEPAEIEELFNLNKLTEGKR